MCYVKWHCIICSEAGLEVIKYRICPAKRDNYKALLYPVGEG